MEDTRSKGKNFYTVTWFYLGNGNVEQVRADTPEEAITKVWFGKKQISYMVFQGRPVLVRDGTEGTVLERSVKVVES